MPVPNYTSPGTENLRADPHVYSGKQTDSPSGGGKDAGGTANLKEKTTTKQAPSKQPSGGSKHWPAGVQQFAEGSV
jgi:hypothetical protein